MPSLGKAYIEVHADTRPFGQELRADLDAYLAEAELRMGDSGKAAGKNFSQNFASETKKGTERIGSDFRTFGDKVERESTSAGNRVRRGFKKGLDASENDTKGYITRLSNYFRSYLFNSVTNSQSILGKLGSFAMQPLQALQLLAGIMLIVVAAASALIPIIASLAGTLMLLAGGAGALGAVFLPLLLLFKDLSPILSKLGDTTKAWKSDLKTLPGYLRPIATVFRDIYNTIKSLNLKGLVTPLLGPLKTLDAFLKSKSFQTFFSGLTKEAGIFFSGLISAFQNANWQSALKAFFGTIDMTVAKVLPLVQQFANTLAAIFNDPNFQGSIQSIVGLIADGASKFLAWIQGAVKNGSFDKWLNQVNGVFYSIWQVLEALGPLIAAFTTPEQMTNVAKMLSTIANVINMISAFLASKRGQQFISDMITLVAVFTTGVLGLILGFGAIDAMLHGVWGFLKGLPGQAKQAFSAMASGISSAWNVVANGVIAAINRVIDGINRLISAYNALPGFGNIPKIPHVSGTTAGQTSSKFTKKPAPGGGGAPPKALAAGGIIARPTLAWVGEKAPEAVIPLTNPSRARALADASGLSNLIRGGDGAQMVVVHVDLNGEPFEEFVAEAFDMAGNQLVTGPRR